MNTQYDKKIRFNQNQARGIFSIRVINENQLVRLMIINKSILLRNRNGYRFHSHQSTAILNLRTQSTTIPKYANPNLLYIYKKGECVESLTFIRWTLTSGNRFVIVGTSHSFMPIEHTQT
mgnify:CR=1 FL=1